MRINSIIIAIFLILAQITTAKSHSHGSHRSHGYSGHRNNNKITYGISYSGMALSGTMGLDGELYYGVIKTKDCPHDCAVDGFCAIMESDIAKCDKKLRT